MALSLSNFLTIAVSLLSSLVQAETRVYNFTATWVNRNPDNLYVRRVMAINGQWPLPRIEGNVGDRIIVNLNNQLGDVPTSIHFHGLNMNGTNEMDGVGGVTQCPVPPGHTITYDFTLNQTGTYWYHSHVDGQYPDGLRGPLIVHDPQNPFQDQFSEELVLTLSDWYHDEMTVLIPQFLNVANPTGAEPVPDSALMNDTQNLQISIQPGTTYYIRIINMAAFAAQHFWIEGHNFTVIELDGVYHEPQETSMLYITAAQRWGILLTTKNDTTANFAICGSMDQDLFDTVPDTLNPNVTSFLVYNSALPMPTPALLDAFDDFDEMNMVPYDHEKLLDDVDLTVTLDVMMNNLGDGKNYAFFNDITYIKPKVPTLYTVMSSGNLSTDPTIYGTNTHTYILSPDSTVELVVNNHDPGLHPFHLHGYFFQALVRSDEDAGDWDPEVLNNGSLTLPDEPMRRDTLVIRPNGHMVLRFKANNPGVWIFHCHIEWHVDSGLTMTFIDSPEIMQNTITIPEDHYAVCNAMNVSTTGNAAGNTVDFLDLTGQNLPPAPLPDGFTARGIVALVFSCIAGILGCVVIAWYGMLEMKEKNLGKEAGQHAVPVESEGSRNMLPGGGRPSAAALMGRPSREDIVAAGGDADGFENVTPSKS